MAAPCLQLIPKKELKNYVKALTQRIDTMETDKETRHTMNTILDFVEKHNK